MNKFFVFILVLYSVSSFSETYICSNNEIEIRIFNHKNLINQGSENDPAIIVSEKQKGLENFVRAIDVSYQAAFTARYDGICQKGDYQYIQISIDDYDIKSGSESPAKLRLGGRYKNLNQDITCIRGSEKLPNPSKNR